MAEPGVMAEKVVMDVVVFMVVPLQLVIRDLLEAEEESLPRVQ
jgi:hypothetical protein